MSTQLIWLFIKMTRPLFLIGGFLLYALGAGLAHYLGVTILWDVYFLGQGWVTFLQLSVHYLNEYFNSPADQDNPNRTPFSGGSGAIGIGKLPRSTALYAALVTLGIAASITVLLLAQGVVSPLLLLLMVLAFLGAFFYSVPPVSLESTGYGELLTSILVAFILPAFGYAIHAGDIHRFLPMVSFPLVTLHLAMLISFSLPDYLTDHKHGKRTLLVRLGWENGMVFHNIMILTAYLLLGISMIMGLPAFVALPAFLSLPLGLFQIFQMRRIANGGKPLWTILTLNGLAIFAFTAYTLTYSFWTH